MFHPYLKVYVDQVERELLFAVDQMIKGEAWRPLSPEQPILGSSNALTEAVRGEVRDCMARVARGATLLDLAAVFQRAYRAYAARLVGRLPKTAAGGIGGAAALGATDWQVRLGEGDLELACLLVTTAEHCQEMVRQLAEALARRVGPALAPRIDFSGEEDEFQTVVAACLSVIVLGIETKVEGGLAAMARHNWAAVETAGDHSVWAGAVRGALAEAGEKRCKRRWAWRTTSGGRPWPGRWRMPARPSPSRTTTGWRCWGGGARGRPGPAGRRQQLPRTTTPSMAW